MLVCTIMHLHVLCLLLQSSILFPNLFIYSPVEGYFGYLYFLAITRNTAINRLLRMNMCSLISWLDCVVGLCLPFQETAKMFSRIVVLFYIPTSVMRIPVALHSYQHSIWLVVFCLFLNFSHSKMLVPVSHCSIKSCFPKE